MCSTRWFLCEEEVRVESLNEAVEVEERVWWRCGEVVVAEEEEQVWSKNDVVVEEMGGLEVRVWLMNAVVMEEEVLRRSEGEEVVEDEMRNEVVWAACERSGEVEVEVGYLRNEGEEDESSNVVETVGWMSAVEMKDENSIVPNYDVPKSEEHWSALVTNLSEEH